MKLRNNLNSIQILILFSFFLNQTHQKDEEDKKQTSGSGWQQNENYEESGKVCECMPDIQTIQNEKVFNSFKKGKKRQPKNNK